MDTQSQNDKDFLDDLEFDIVDEIELPLEERVAFSKEIKESIREEIGKIPIGKIVSTLLEKEVLNQNEKTNQLKESFTSNISQTKKDIEKEVEKVKSNISEITKKLNDKYANLKTNILNQPKYQFGGFAPPNPLGHSDQFLTNTAGTWDSIAWSAVNAQVDIGDTIGGGTSGSVLFIDASGNLGQDNTNLFWDDTLNEAQIFNVWAKNIVAFGTDPASRVAAIYHDGINLVLDGQYTGAVGGIHIHTHQRFGMGVDAPSYILEINNTGSDEAVAVAGDDLFGIVGKSDQSGYLFQFIAKTGQDPQFVMHPTTGILINPDQGANSLDFKVNGVTKSSLLFVDVSADFVGINNASPNSHLALGGSFSVPVTSQSSAYPIVSTDCIVLVSGNTTVTLPTAVGITGRLYIIKKTDSASTTVTIATTSSQTIDGQTTVAFSEQYKCFTVISDNANWQVI